MEFDRMGSIKRGKIERQSSIVKRDIKVTSNKPTGTSLGQSFEERQIFFTQKDRENHTHVIGSTGTGKSKFLEHMIRQDLLNSKAGLCLIDPHGSLYEEILLYISHKYPRLADRVILFNPAEETENVLGFNPIPLGNDNIDYILEMLISACLKAWGQDSSDKTPRITRWLENIFYALIVNEMTFVEATPLISTTKYSKPFRERFYSNVDSREVIEDWLQYEDFPVQQRSNIMEGAGNRLRKFLRNDIVRNIIGIQEKSVDLLHIMNEGKILLVNLNGKDRISNENTKLLGVMLVNELFRTAKLRNARDPSLKPFYCYIDEFGQFVTRDIARALEECRKFKLFMVLAHQHLAQLKKEDEYLYASVMTNCKNKVVFGGLSVEDVEVMSGELLTGFVDLKKIKDEMYSTKVRYFEETRRVLGKSKADSTSTNTATTTGTSESEGYTQGNARGTSNSVTQSKGSSQTQGTGYSKDQGVTNTQGEGESWGESESHGQSQTRGTTQGYSDGVSQTKGYTHGNSESETQGYSHAQSRSHSDGKNWSKGTSTNDGRNTSTGNNRSLQYDADGDRTGLSKTRQQGAGRNQSKSISDSQGGSSNDTYGSSDTQSQSKTAGRNESWSESESKTHTDSFSESFSESESIQRGTSHNRSKNNSQAISENETHSENKSTSESWNEGTSQGESFTENESHSKSTGSSHSVTEGRTQGRTLGESEALVPFLRPEEYQELSSRTFWTKEELHYMGMADIKNQDTGQAFIKVGSSAPIRTQIDFVKSTYFSSVNSLKRINEFREKVFLKNESYYTPLPDVQMEFVRRQVKFFGEPLNYKDAHEYVESQASITTEDDSFENPLND